MREQVKKDKETVAVLRRDALGNTFKRGKKRRYLSVQGGLSLAARRSLSRAGPQAIGMVLGLDLSGRCIRSWEIRLRASLLAGFRICQKRGYHMVVNNPGHTTGLRFALLRIRSDATHSNIWQKSKLCVTELMSRFTIQPIRSHSSWSSIADATTSDKILAPLQVVPAGTARHTLGIITKQLRQLTTEAWPFETSAPRTSMTAITDGSWCDRAKCPLPLADRAVPAAAALEAAPPPPAIAAEPFDPVHGKRNCQMVQQEDGGDIDAAVAVICITTDAGGDIHAARELVSAKRLRTPPRLSST